ALSNNAPHGSHFRPPTKTHRINSHDNYPDAAGFQHGAIEKYNKRGKHLGEFNHITGEQTKSPNSARTVEP
ncbi:colicin E3/pyocin S6 family cytotoxin, partial [Stutzerimonas stutzeri]|uniref:colicin E3/pyocin S6 family cytotoxin n=1 Tax=Stutzerimonas stutzeri TaxID=316 RepID=UPI003D0865F8